MYSAYKSSLFTLAKPRPASTLFPLVPSCLSPFFSFSFPPSFLSHSHIVKHLLTHSPFLYVIQCLARPVFLVHSSKAILTSPLIILHNSISFSYTLPLPLATRHQRTCCRVVSLPLFHTVVTRGEQPTK